MHIHVDRSACRRHGQCVHAAPEVFALEEEGDLVVLQPESAESQRARVLEAVDLCPMQALSVED